MEIVSILGRDYVDIFRYPKKAKNPEKIHIQIWREFSRLHLYREKKKRRIVTAFFCFEPCRASLHICMTDGQINKRIPGIVFGPRHNSRYEKVKNKKKNISTTRATRSMEGKNQKKSGRRRRWRRQKQN
jgi:hypothetical protein